MEPREEQAIRYAVERGMLTAAQVAEAQRSLAPGESLVRRVSANLSPEQRAELAQVYRASGRQQAPDVADTQATLAPAASPSSSGRAAGVEALGPYRIVRELARGGMGVVYVAERPGLDRQVALKVLLPGGDASLDELERFLREARISARLRHPNIVAVHDVGRDQGKQYFVMDLIEGRSLKQRLDAEGPLPVREAAELTRTLAEALSYAHGLAVLHRDLKPHNVLLDERGEPLLTDFGLAKDVGQTEGGLTRTGQIMGTPAYMPPEQAEGQPDLVDRRSDVYSLGATLYHALTGAPPFQGATALNIISQVFSKDPVAPRKLRPEVDRDLETICLRCLEKEPAARYPSAQALAEDLGRYIADEPILARPPGVLERARRFVRRHRALTGAAVVVALLATAGTVVSLRAQASASASAAQRERDRAVEEARQARAAAEADYAALQERLLSGRGLDDLEALPARRRQPLLDPLLAQALAAYTAAQRWRAVDPGADAASACCGAALRLSRLARLAESWALATEMAKLAAGLGSEEAAALEGALSAARTEGARRRRSRIEARLAQAAQQDPLARDHEAWRMDAVYEVIRSLDEENVSLLVDAVTGLTRILVQRTRERFEAAGRSGEAIPGLDGALDAWQAMLRDGRLLEPRHVLPLRTAHARLLEQGAELPTQARDLRARWTAADLACEALGRVEWGRAHAGALGAHLLAITGGPRLVPPAQALQRLGTPEALRFLRTGQVAARRLWRDDTLKRWRVFALAAFDPRAPFELLEQQVSVLREGQRVDEALKRVTAWRSARAGEHPEAAALEAELQLERGEGPAAERLLGSLSPELRARALGSWAETLSQRGKPRRAEAAFTRALALLGEARTPERAALLAGRARVWVGYRYRVAEALRDLEESLSIHPNDPLALRYRAEALLLRGDAAAAVRDLDRVIALAPRAYPMAWILRGQVRILRGGGQQAAFRDLDTGVRLGPDRPRVWIERGVCHAQTGDLRAALSDLDRGLRLDPRSEHGLSSRAQVWTKLGKPQRALADYERLINNAPKIARWRFARGRARAQVGDVPGAIADLELGLKLEPEHPLAPQVRAMLQRLRGR